VRIIEDPLFADKVFQAEFDLIESYLEGELSAAERELFDTQYLNSLERRERVNEIRLLKNYAVRPAETPVVDLFVYGTPWYRRIRILAPAFGFVILVVVACLFFLGRGAVGGVDYAQLNRQDLRDPAVIGNSQIVVVNAGTFRSGTNRSALLVKVDSPAVLFRLPLNFPVEANSVYDALIEREGRKMFSVEPVRLYSDDGSLEARIFAPSDALTAGTYQIRLVRRDSDDAPVLYAFDVR